MADRVIDYDIVQSDDLEELVQAMRDQLRGGWLPLGGIAVIPDAELPYVQAVVKFGPAPVGGIIPQ